MGFEAEICPQCGGRVVSPRLETVFCPRCRGEIPSHTRFCKFCGAALTQPTPQMVIPPVRKSYAKKIVAIIAIILLVVVPTASYIQNRTFIPTYDTSQQTAQLHYDATIRYTERYADTIGYSEPLKGYTYLILTFDISNNIDRDFSTNPNSFKVTINNIVYDYDSATFSLEDQLRSVDVQKGGRITGSLAFEVPQGATEYTITYDPFLSFHTWNIEWIHY